MNFLFGRKQAHAGSRIQILLCTYAHLVGTIKTGEKKKEKQPQKAVKKREKISGAQAWQKGKGN